MARLRSRCVPDTEKLVGCRPGGTWPDRGHSAGRSDRQVRLRFFVHRERDAVTTGGAAGPDPPPVGARLEAERDGTVRAEVDAGTRVALSDCTSAIRTACWQRRWTGESAAEPEMMVCTICRRVWLLTCALLCGAPPTTCRSRRGRRGRSGPRVKPIQMTEMDRARQNAAQKNGVCLVRPLTGSTSMREVHWGLSFSLN